MTVVIHSDLYDERSAMQKRIYLVISLIIGLPIMATEKYIYYTSNGATVHYSKNSFGDTIIDTEHLWRLCDKFQPKEFSGIVAEFVSHLKGHRPKKAFKIDLPWKYATLVEDILEAGFEIFTSTSQSVELIYKNGSPIHEPQTAILGAHVAILGDDNMVLIEEEKSRAGIIDLPCGAVERGEFIFHAGAREAHEEIGLTIDPEKLRLFALLNRKKYSK